ncbi:MAG: protein kinase [Vicinamibacterales bacterium]|nr:protein kinase [Vicinamibacterales bacterium]
MEPERWARVKALFESAQRLPADRRRAWLVDACDDAAVVSEVDALLIAYEDDPGFLEAPVAAAKAGEALLEQIGKSAEGRLIGSYRVVRELGRGGMGVVYEALRTGDEFSRRVAIKVLSPGWSASTLAERFRFERQVLAGLDHPGIARLYDAGATGDGVPYFVMEYVDGQPVDVWCRERALTVRQCVELMIRICEAVVHAHRNFVVHRDLKPANILVTGDGQPKLLGFGIARMLSEEVNASPGLTRTGQYAFTPEYASPEQVRGAAITTASDVYSLGMLIYLLSTGRPAYSLSGLGPMDAMRAVCETEPQQPSLLAAEPNRSALRGDLDRVILKALRKLPAERYATVAALADDLRAWLEGRVVSAVPATSWYRARKSLARHKMGAAVTAGVVVALVAGGATTAWQAHVARAERDKAERRFQQVRQFADSLLFDVHDALRKLPGATEPRRLLLERAVQFLDGLAQDASRDTTLALELAEAYRKLGQVQGSQVSENVGDVGAARASFEKAAGLCDAVLAREPDSLHAMVVATGAYDDLSNARRSSRDAAGAEQAYRRHEAIAVRLERTYPNDPAAMASVASSYANLGYFRGQVGDTAGAQELYAQAIGAFEALPRETQAEIEAIRMFSFALKRSAAIHVSENRLAEGEILYRRALALDEALVASHPDNAAYRYDMTFSLSDLAFVARRQERPADAESLYLRALEIRQKALDADPNDVRALTGVSNLHNYLGTVYRDLKRAREELGHRRANLELQKRLLSLGGPTAGVIEPLVWASAYLAAALLDAADAARSVADRTAAITEARQVLAEANRLDRRLAGGSRYWNDALALLDEQSARLRRLGG